MKKAIDTRNFHTAVHELYEILHKPKTVLKAFRELEEIEDNNLWEFIQSNTKFLGEFNCRNIDRNNQVFFKEEKYQIINPVFFDVY